MLDPLNPYYLSSNEHPALTLISTPLNDLNYHSWSQTILLILGMKNKVCFVDGSLPRPAVIGPSQIAWDRCNKLVLSWIIQSFDATIIQSVQWMQNAFEVWMDLKNRYAQHDMFKISDLFESIYSLKQGTLSITAYFTALQGLWKELDQFHPIPSCSCNIPCSCDLIPTVKSYRERMCYSIS
jgi:hypothetical protein